MIDSEDQSPTAQAAAASPSERPDGSRRDPAGPLFFVHVMKTAGSTFRRRMIRELGRDAVFPVPGLDPAAALPNVEVGYLAGLPAERHAGIRGYAPHLPYFATQLVPTPSHVLTILRHPVERTISYLKMHHRDRGLGPDRTLESIYELPYQNALHIKDYQVRVFATTADEGIETVLTPVHIDDRRMELAKAHLRSVDILGLQEDFDLFVDEAVRRLGWRPNLLVKDQRRSAPVEVSSTLRRRIAEDNPADVEFYEYARDLVAERRRLA